VRRRRRRRRRRGRGRSSASASCSSSRCECARLCVGVCACLRQCVWLAEAMHISAWSSCSWALGGGSGCRLWLLSGRSTAVAQPAPSFPLSSPPAPPALSLEGTFCTTNAQRAVCAPAEHGGRRRGLQGPRHPAGRPRRRQPGRPGPAGAPHPDFCGSVLLLLPCGVLCCRTLRAGSWLGCRGSREARLLTRAGLALCQLLRLERA
jgi:hypothetical protein